jgi:hypothetical protein
MSVKDAELTQAEIRAAKKLLEYTLRPRGIPFYSPEERMVLSWQPMLTAVRHPWMKELNDTPNPCQTERT